MLPLDLNSTCETVKIMAKKSTAQTTQGKPRAQTTATVDIDDIFASKPKPAKRAKLSIAESSGSAVAPTSVYSSSSSSKVAEAQKATSTANLKKRAKLGKAIPAFIPDTDASSADLYGGATGSSASTIKSSKRRVEEVLDPSIPGPPQSAGSASNPSRKTKRAYRPAAGAGVQKKAKRKDEVNEDEMFADSRGNGLSGLPAFSSLKPAPATILS